MTMVSWELMRGIRTTSSSLDSTTIRAHVPMSSRSTRRERRPCAWNRQDGALGIVEDEKSVPQVKLIVSDVDGTLLTSAKQELTDRTLRAIRRAEEEKGVPCMIATGKACGPWTAQILPALASPMPQIFLQGLYIRDAQGHVMYSRTLDISVIEQVVGLARELDVTLVAYSSDRILCDKTDVHTDRLVFYGEPVPEPVGDILSYLSNNPCDIFKCIFMADSESITTRVHPMVHASLDRVSLTSALTGMLEVLPAESSKGKGVKFVLDTLGIHPDNVMALGDGDNDVEMLDMVGLGIAVANASPALKKHATLISPYTNDQDAVAHAIEDHVLVSYEVP